MVKNYIFFDILNNNVSLNHV